MGSAVQEAFGLSYTRMCAFRALCCANRPDFGAKDPLRKCFGAKLPSKDRILGHVPSSQHYRTSRTSAFHALAMGYIWATR